MATSVKQFIGLGRRKEATVRVYLRPGSGKIVVNKQEVKDYFPSSYVVDNLMQPLIITNKEKEFDVIATASGGGFAAQGDALRLGISKALVETDQNLRPILKQHGFLKTDSRVVERKKYGLKKARRAPQFSKR